MSTYEALKGLKVKYLSADTSGDREVEGELYYNSADFNLKSHLAVAAWSSSSHLINDKVANGNVGIQTAALSCGGFTSVPDGNPDRKVTTEEYGGVVWSAAANMNTAKSSGVTYGTQTAALAAQGESVNSEEYNGTAWTEGNNMGTARGENGIQFGIQTAAVAAGGSPNKALVEEYDGSSWSEVNNLPAANFAGHGAGTLTAGLGFGGYTTATAAETLAYDGTNWTDVGNMNLARRNGTANFGTASLAYVAGGITPAGSRQTTGAFYDGTSWAALPASLGTGRQHNGGIGAGGSSTTAGLACGGNVAPNNSTGITEEFIITTSTITNSTWASGGNMPAAKNSGQGAGIQTAGLQFGSVRVPSSPNTGGLSTDVETNEYDGSSWTAGGDMNTGRSTAYGTGVQTAALAAGGRIQNNPFAYTANSEEYNGTSWTEGNNLGAVKYYTNRTGAGIQTAALMVGGYDASAGSPTSNVEEYNGTSWSEVNNAPEVLLAIAGCGTQTAAIFTGNAPNPTRNKVYLYDGTNWTISPAAAGSFEARTFAGTQASGIVAAGAASTIICERWDGTTFSQTANLSTARESHSASSGTLAANYVCGGNNPGDSVVASTEEYSDGVVISSVAKSIDFD